MSQKCKKPDCKAWATEDGFCFFHSPELTQIRHSANQKGGAVGKEPKDRILAKLGLVEFNKTEDVVIVLGETINLVRLGLIDLKAANCIGSLSNYLLRAFEQNDLEGRLDELEKKVSENNKRK